MIDDELVTVPDRAIISDCERPFATNKEVSWLRLKPVTLAAVDLNSSTLPNPTEYDGPPA
ncbi:hypothetical protein GW17_00057742 [Ensete ventricosum]|nr:hypothetical protein GW17_00057742 [Ensete ventricosum]